MFLNKKLLAELSFAEIMLDIPLFVTFLYLLYELDVVVPECLDNVGELVILLIGKLLIVPVSWLVVVGEKPVELLLHLASHVPKTIEFKLTNTEILFEAYCLLYP